ncbi:type I inositol polyphosphate 5-phosphatase 10-like isoform X1 [Cucurbita moschata]|uniref:Type I inositol polyphosphate 5-phosphatase 10-like isoform X1 n=2 Tax=Cucurbita moschata TaxID=3662 RepID=A0A6J1GY28_CUCMO|nr:type I inositol polyphosphate 5-phosphatase 10-like isoform X1 [Cucurbita moschata]XP_022956531.1 type I inositol polyphosphate 5-phosphatase 10-like isoform X1 [Cucurbita moschata]XP_022956539.1 type I inositol polyphosphate 5-phosphatase 10-like isoform X1 [Cucurbita moschata]XP_022956545.1 type I inositol polyphosphate 5-phosphatase 10-like isoform X1 [Cucurbita moschata]
MTFKEQDSRKKSFIRKIFAMGERNGKREFKGSFESTGKGLESISDLELDSAFLGSTDSLMSRDQEEVQSFRVFVATWNVGGKSPHTNLNLNDFIKNDDSADIYIFGFQEIVPLNAGNVLVIEDNEPAARWLSLINQSLNNPINGCSRGPKPATGFSGSKFFPKPSLKSISKTFRTVSRRKLKSCNCTPLELERKRSKDFWFRCQPSHVSEDGISSEEDEEEDPSVFDISEISIPESGNEMKYGLIASKQMVGIFVTIWMRKELVPYVSHLRIASTSRGIMGCLGNKGCISVSMLFHQTSFCFICSHLASGEKEGDELRRNLDVIEILKNTQFPKICRTPDGRMPEKILGHKRIIWLGDLNYRIALSYLETRRLMEANHWDELLNKDQLKIERDAGRVFYGWKEGTIYFAPTYKYYYNSDTYAGDSKKSKKKRRTPAWCDRILWHGDGIRQLYYIRGESQFSDHRPVCATFLVDVTVVEGGAKKKMPGSNMKVGAEEILSTNSRYYYH